MLCKSVEVIPHVWERASRKRLERVGPFKKVKCKLFGWTFGLSHLKWAHQIFREPVGNSTRLLVGARGNTWCASPACGELQRDVLQSGEEKKSSFYEDIKCSSDKVSHIAASMLWLLLATIVPVPKKPWPTQPNYYRPHGPHARHNKVPGETAAKPPCARCHCAAGSPPICLCGYEGYRGCDGLCTAPPTSESWLSTPLCQDPLHGLQLCFSRSIWWSRSYTMSTSPPVCSTSNYW